MNINARINRIEKLVGQKTVGGTLRTYAFISSKKQLISIIPYERDMECIVDMGNGFVPPNILHSKP